MKKVMLIGKTADAMKGLGEFLSSDLNVMYADLDQESIADVLDTFMPDIIVISLESVREASKPTLTLITTKYSNIPVITLGTPVEADQFVQYYKAERFENIPRSADNSEIRAAIERRISGENSEKKKAYVLVIDDDMSLLHSVKSMLEDDYEVGIAASAPAGIKMMSKRMPDLVLLDYEMPHCDGRQALEMIRNAEATKDIPVVFLTSITDRDHIDAVLGLSPHGYLVKPVAPAQLKEAIEKVLYYL